MGATSGMKPILDYVAGNNPVTGVAMSTDKLRVGGLLSLIPDPDTGKGSSGSVVGKDGIGNTWLDEMSPACAAQLRVELAAIVAAVT